MRQVSVLILVVAAILAATGCGRDDSGAHSTTLASAVVDPTTNDRSPAQEQRSLHPRLNVETDVKAARKRAKATGKPLLVLSVLGDWTRHC